MNVVQISRGHTVSLGTFTDVGTGTGHRIESVHTTFQASSDASHTGTTIVNIEVSNDLVSWFLVGTISVTGNSDSDGFAMTAPYKQVRAKIDTGNHGDATNAVTVTMSEA